MEKQQTMLLIRVCFRKTLSIILLVIIGWGLDGPGNHAFRSQAKAELVC